MRDSHSRKLEKRSSIEIFPSPSQSKLSPSVSRLTSLSMSGFILHRFSSRSHSVNQYSKPSYMPSSSVSGFVGSDIPRSVERIAFGGTPACQSLKSFNRRLPRVSLVMRMLNTRCAFSVGCWTSPSRWSSGASEGCSKPLVGASTAIANSWLSISPSASPSKSPSPATNGLRVQVSAVRFHEVNNCSMPSIMPSPSVSTLFGSHVHPVRFT